MSFKSKLRKIYLSLKNDYSYLTKYRVRNIKKNWYGNSYGGFYVAPSLLSSNSIIYSIGIGEDISFDLDIINNHKCLVHGFDPTPKSIEWFNENYADKLKEFKLYEYGLGVKTGFIDFYLPKNKNHVSGSFISQVNVNESQSIKVLLKSFDDIVRELNHTHIDVLKIDIEGAEYCIIENILNSKIKIKQILIEFHDRFFPDGLEKTKHAISLFHKSGYKIFALSDTYEEISFILEP